MAFLRTAHEGEVFIDHRSSPGIPAAKAERMGFEASQVREGSTFTAATFGCPHCGGHVMMNPARKRERAFCDKCDRYICDGCDGVRRHPDYKHRTMKEIIELVGSGKMAFVGGTMARPVLIPTENING